MALRIIRKSASQSHVELIKGTNENADRAKLSLLVYLQSLEDLENFKSLLYIENSWINTNCEVILMKSKAIDSSIRSELTPMPYTIKLLTEPETLSASKRLHILIQEAASEYCIYFSHAPKDFENIESIYQHFEASPTAGAVGLSVTNGEQILCHGLSLVQQDYDLIFNQNTFKMTSSIGSPQALFAGLPVSLLQELGGKVLNTTALPTNGLALRKSAYLKTKWEDQKWDENWAGFELCLKLHQAQYWVQTLPLSIQFPESSLWSSDSEFFEAWQQDLVDDHEEVYQQAGFKKMHSNAFEWVKNESEENQILAYLEQISS